MISSPTKKKMNRGEMKTITNNRATSRPAEIRNVVTNLLLNISKVTKRKGVTAVTHEVEVTAEDSKISVTVVILEALAAGDRSRKKRNLTKTGISEARKKTTWMTMRMCQRLRGIQCQIVGREDFLQVIS